MGQPFSTLEIPTLKGGGGASNGQDRVSVFKTLWKRIFKWLVLKSWAKIMTSNFVLVQRPLQSALYIQKQN